MSLSDHTLLDIKNAQFLPAADAEAPGSPDSSHTRVLYDIMSCMRDVRKRAERTDGSFEPLRETVGALTGAGVALPDGVLRQVGGGGVPPAFVQSPTHLCLCSGLCAHSCLPSATKQQHSSTPCTNTCKQTRTA